MSLIYNLQKSIYGYRGADPVFTTEGRDAATKCLESVNTPCFLAKITSVMLVVLAAMVLSSGGTSVAISLSVLAVFTWITAHDVYKIAENQDYLTGIGPEQFIEALKLKRLPHEQYSDTVRHPFHQALVKGTYVSWYWLHLLTGQKYKPETSGS